MESEFYEKKNSNLNFMESEFYEKKIIKKSSDIFADKLNAPRGPTSGTYIQLLPDLSKITPNINYHIVLLPNTDMNRY